MMIGMRPTDIARCWSPSPTIATRGARALAISPEHDLLAFAASWLTFAGVLALDLTRRFRLGR